MLKKPINFSRISAYNNSSVFGGQEQYLVKLKRSLEEKVISLTIITTVRNLNEYLDSDSEDIMLVLNGNKALYDFFLHKKRKPIIYIQHSDIADSQGPLYKIIIRKILLYFLLKKVDAVIRVCNKCLPDKYAKGKISTVYNGVELKTKIAKTLPDNLNLLMVGAINENKNQKLAIESLAQLKGVTLSLLGSGPDVSSLTQLAKKLGVSERVKWLGFKDDPEPYYQQADLLLMLSKNEAFPFVVLEAMAHGIPVVAAPVGGVPEAITHLDNGLLLDSYQPKSLVNAIKSIQHDSVLYSKLSENSIATIKNRFSLENMTQGFLAVVEQVLEKRGIK